MKTVSYFAAAVLMCISWLPAQQTTTAPVADVKIVEGYGLSSTEPDALTQAKRDAVEKGIGVILISQTEVKNFMLEKDVVITKTLGAVKKYEVLSSAKTSDGLFEVKIKAEVSLASIKADIATFKILLETMDKPRAMVLVQESRNNEVKPGYNSAATGMIDFLTEKGFNLVDPAQVAALIGSNDEYIAQAAAGDPVAAAKLGRDNGAEVILVGKASGSLAADNPMLGGMKSGQADINITVINCQTGKVITAKNVHQAKPHISGETAMSQALLAAGKKIMDRELFEKIVAHWQDQANNGLDLRVLIKGVDSFSKLKDVKSFIQTVSPSVVTITQRVWTQESGQLELDIVFKGNAESFCEYVDGKATTGGIKLAVVNFTSGSVALSAQ